MRPKALWVKSSVRRSIVLPKCGNREWIESRVGIVPPPPPPPPPPPHRHRHHQPPTPHRHPD
jgi:hypothetical protein